MPSDSSLTISSWQPSGNEPTKILHGPDGAPLVEGVRMRPQLDRENRALGQELEKT